ncbi:MAG TPA: hypothetical protein PK801_08120 [Aggregatilineales bacterium]|nr:hypothetical protein [Chloroflexota bacterium]HOA22391.1 hypothetical protein [Aggregatilineales bacterium]HPV08149.1 hypothetical protein [Aggregatilineales bacterium]HQA68275.1 hypothetical protein [Aggregatilineales bacterium]HQE17386.1 hypothetical protein [Aggregatilineales bacterium]
MIYEWHLHLKHRNKREKPKAAHQKKPLGGLFAWPGAPSPASMPFFCGPYIAAARI